MHLVEKKLFSFDAKLLCPLKIKLNPIKNIKSLVSISNRKQKPLDQARFCRHCHNFVQIILMKNKA